MLRQRNSLNWFSASNVIWDSGLGIRWSRAERDEDRDK